MKSCLAVMGALAAAGAAAGSDLHWCIVGSAAGGANDESIHVLSCNDRSGEITLEESSCGFHGTTYFAFDAGAGRIYTTGVAAPAAKGKKASALSYAFAGGRLSRPDRLAELPCEAACHVALHPVTRRPYFATYVSAMVLTLAESGKLSSAVLDDAGVGPNAARQKKAYAHQIFFTPGGGRVGAVNLGCDRIHFFDPQTLAEDKSLTVRLDAGDGPRHAIWSKDSKFLFVLGELTSTVTSFAYDGGKFRRVGRWPALPGDFKGESKAAAIKLTRDGGILMVSNRGHDSIAFFAVDGTTGELTLRNIAKLQGSFPRDFELMPSEKFMVVGHKHDNEVQSYRFDRASCTLESVGRPVPLWKPLCFMFVPSAAPGKAE